MPAPPFPNDPPPGPQFGRAPLEIDALSDGIVSGPGNQGTTNQAKFGHAGTPNTQAGSPRGLRF
jgi:hypothetical protein